MPHEVSNSTAEPVSSTTQQSRYLASQPELAPARCSSERSTWNRYALLMPSAVISGAVGALRSAEASDVRDVATAALLTQQPNTSGDGTPASDAEPSNTDTTPPVKPRYAALSQIDPRISSFICLDCDSTHSYRAGEIAALRGRYLRILNLRDPRQGIFLMSLEGQGLVRLSELILNSAGELIFHVPPWLSGLQHVSVRTRFYPSGPLRIAALPHILHDRDALKTQRNSNTNVGVRRQRAPSNN